jgi:hypothetical protein
MIKVGDDQYYAHPFGGPLKLDVIKRKLATYTSKNPSEKYIENNIIVNQIETYKIIE